MTNESDYIRELLVCLTEECAEVQKDACKALRFGLDDHHPDHADTNRMLIARELGDVLCVLDLLVEAGVIDTALVEQAMKAKRVKLAKFMRYKPSTSA